MAWKPKSRSKTGPSERDSGVAPTRANMVEEIKQGDIVQITESVRKFRIGKYGEVIKVSEPDTLTVKLFEPVSGAIGTFFTRSSFLRKVA